MGGPTSPAGDSGLKRASGDCLPDFADVLLRWISPRIFEEKLASIINSVGEDQAFLPPMPDRVYRDAASLGHFRDGEHVPGAGRIGLACRLAFTKPS